MSGEVRIEYSEDWKTLLELFKNPAIFMRRLEVNVRKANRKIATNYLGHLREAIRKGIAPPNAPLTRAIKRKSTGMWDRGTLEKAFKILQPSWDVARLTVPETAKAKNGHSLAGLLIYLQADQEIPVTNPMRRMFRVLEMASKSKDRVAETRKKIHNAKRGGRKRSLKLTLGRRTKKYGDRVAGLTGRAAELWARNPTVKWQRLSRGTKVIRIPGRPFVKTALVGKARYEYARRAWKAAVTLALKEALKKR